MSKEAQQNLVLSHFTLNGCATGSFAGVERVMATQQDLLARGGVGSTMIVGDTDHPAPAEYGIIVYPQIKSGAHKTWSVGETIVDEAVVTKIVEDLNDMAGENPIIFHNTTNASRHNPPFGVAAARLVDQRVYDGAADAALWIHDSRNVDPRQLDRLLPDSKWARIVTISNIRKEQLITSLENMRRYGIEKPLYDIPVIPNPIDEAFTNGKRPRPSSLTELAPNVVEFGQQNNLKQNPTEIENLLFVKPDALKLILPARIVAQKGIEKAIAATHAYSEQYGQKVALIVTGTPDVRKPENAQYWERIKDMVALNGHSSAYTYFLGGIEWRYMPWMYSNSDLLIAPFKNEGFGMPPLEAACCGVPSAIANDPALLETTDGNALVVPEEVWERPFEVARRLHDYLGSNKARDDVHNLSQKVHAQYSVDAVMKHMKQVFALS